VRQNRLDGDVTDEIYYPVAVTGIGDVRAFLRTSGAIPPVVRAFRAIVANVDPQQPVSSIETLEQIRGAQLAEPRLTATVLTSFAALALILTATGLAGVIGYSVTQRLPEIAIRIALGSDSRRVVALVVRDGLAIVAAGLVIGFVISLFGMRLVTRLPFHVAANDTTTFVLACVLITLMAAVAFLIPSRRALRTDPAGVFRGA
jgi:ABC-type transport system, involved in lipoprotein release, permease component